MLCHIMIYDVKDQQEEPTNCIHITTVVRINLVLFSGLLQHKGLKASQQQM